jgi:hypothetical protein
MRNEWNRVANVGGNGTVNLSAPIPRAGLWLSRETLGRHVLNVFHPYSLRDVW